MTTSRNYRSGEWVIVTVTLASLLTLMEGCASINRYHEPVAAGSAHLIGSSERHGAFDWQRLSVNMIDNFYVPSKIIGNDATIRVALDPSPHHIVAQVTFNREFAGGGPYSTLITIPFQPQFGADYRLAGRVHDSMFDAWVEESNSGERVSDVVSAPYQEQPRITYVPIYVPPSR